MPSQTHWPRCLWYYRRKGHEPEAGQPSNVEVALRWGRGGWQRNTQTVSPIFRRYGFSVEQDLQAQPLSGENHPQPRPEWEKHAGSLEATNPPSSGHTARGLV